MSADDLNASFRATSYPVRLHAGHEALTQIAAEAKRLGASRAFVICGRTVATRTNTIERIAAVLGPSLVGTFTEMDKDSSWTAVAACVAAARELEPDLLIAVGGGSVIVGTRVVSILLSEAGDPYDLMTQYPENAPAHSPRLTAPKIPIFNVVTTPTSAMNRGGSALKNDALDHRMEFYDPKTRPAALFWDAQALLTAPTELIRSTATTTFCGALRALGAENMNPLLEGNRRQAFRLVRRALPRIMDEPDNAALRVDLCAAAFLDNRSADDDLGRRRERDDVGARCYALATALHIRYQHVWQGESTSCLLPTVTRKVAPANPEHARRIAEALQINLEGMTPQSVAEATAGELDRLFEQIGMPSRLSQVNVPRDELALLANDTLKNFNANPGMRSDTYVQDMIDLLEAAW
ncbi:MAG: iron-containing alcohol dehydrogenase [Gammaproteobacteria bacterium]|nr:iron-containing alcohol dehydrogenase [Gammaproteobacteria bacterium]